MVKITFCKHRLIKISMAYVHIKPKLKKSNAAVITTTINEACIEWLIENYYLVREIFLALEMSKILAAR